MCNLISSNSTWTKNGTSFEPQKWIEMNEFSYHLQSQITSLQLLLLSCSLTRWVKDAKSSSHPILAMETATSDLFRLVPRCPVWMAGMLLVYTDANPESCGIQPEFNTTGSPLPTWGSTSTWNWNRSWRDERQSSGLRAVCQKAAEFSSRNEPNYTTFKPQLLSASFCMMFSFWHWVFCLFILTHLKLFCEECQPAVPRTCPWFKQMSPWCASWV